MIFYATFFLYVGKKIYIYKYIHWHCSSSPSMFLRCFCTIFVPNNGVCSTKIFIYICLVFLYFSDENLKKNKWCLQHTRDVMTLQSDRMVLCCFAFVNPKQSTASFLFKKLQSLFNAVELASGIPSFFSLKALTFWSAPESIYLAKPNRAQHSGKVVKLAMCSEKLNSDLFLQAA